MSLTKGQIFDLFYSKQDVVRSGGGKVKSKMTRRTPTNIEISELEKRVNDFGNSKLTAYFQKLKNRKSDIAPPPRPAN
jgi:hypothetical protein